MEKPLRKILTEIAESLSVLDVELSKLAQDPNRSKVLGGICLLVDSIDKNCGSLGLPRLEAVARAAKDVLGKYQDGDLKVTPEAITAISESIDAIVVELEAAAPAANPEKAAAKGVDDDVDEESAKASVAAAPTLRVHVKVLDDLMTMVSEMVLTRNQLMQILRTHDESEFAAPLQRLNQITSELQEGVTKTRMQPIGNAWTELPRIVRDLAVDLGKKIELEMLGADTELDRQLLDLIKTPLTHMVRNAVDHGIERPERRRAAGKPETGKITLNAYHEGGHILIEISDDGRGLATDEIRAKALANGLASETELEGMSEQQIQQFVFRAGFSTAEKDTKVSGRGGGIDVVRTSIEKIGGTIELKSAEGKGTRFIIKIPLTLAIVAALIVECGGERFAIPQLSVLELVRASNDSEHRVETLNATPVLRLRDRLLPLVDLREMLKLHAAEDSDAAQEAENEPTTQGGERFIVVIQVGTYTMGVIVDRVFDTEEIVFKPVAPILRDIPIFSGSTILGDGSVIMIIDPNGIVGSVAETVTSDTQSTDVVAAHEAQGEEEVSLLVFRAMDRTPKAVPLALVARLEEFEVDQIESADGTLMVQYRGQLMPLVQIGAEHRMREGGRQPVIVFTDRDRSMGLVVDDIVDIVEQALDVELTGEKQGVLGTAVVAGKATDIIDVSHYLTAAFGDWFTVGDGALGKANGKRRLLLVDDSPFFRNLLTPILSVAGYEVTSVESGDRALELCEAGRDFDLIISDIEMPGKDGFEFAKAVRDGSRWRDTPLVALSVHGAATDIERGREAGFTDYVAKSDRDALLSTLNQILTGDAA